MEDLRKLGTIWPSVDDAIGELQHQAPGFRMEGTEQMVVAGCPSGLFEFLNVPGHAQEFSVLGVGNHELLRFRRTRAAGRDDDLRESEQALLPESGNVETVNAHRRGSQQPENERTERDGEFDIRQ